MTRNPRRGGADPEPGLFDEPAPEPRVPRGDMAPDARPRDVTPDARPPGDMAPDARPRGDVTPDARPRGDMTPEPRSRDDVAPAARIVPPPDAAPSAPEPAPTPAPKPARPEPPPPPPLYTVSQLTAAIGGCLAELGKVRVEGEVSETNKPGSGHLYFNLKDQGAVLRCTLWKSQIPRALRFALADGAKVLVHGRLEAYAPRGSYSLIVDRIEPLGIGALLAQLEERKRELAARGWFDRKRALPIFPRVIGVVTSRDGAALFDFLKTRSARWPGYPVRLVHTSVQGPGAAASIAAALRALDRSGVDVIALVRGGGSLEDLWAFNELPVLEAIWSASVPVVSGVGHQTDVTLADHVADHRAHTPTDAAQLVIPDRRELAERVARLGNHLVEAFDRAWSDREERLARVASRPVLSGAGWILGERTRSLATLHARLDRALHGALERRASVLARSHAKLARRSPEGELARRAQRLAVAAPRLGLAVRAALERREQAVAAKARALEAVSPLAVLARGYSITRASDGSAVTDAGTLRTGDALETKLASGSVRSRVESVRPDETSA